MTDAEFIKNVRDLLTMLEARPDERARILKSIASLIATKIALAWQEKD